LPVRSIGTAARWDEGGVLVDKWRNRAPKTLLVTPVTVTVKKKRLVDVVLVTVMDHSPLGDAVQHGVEGAVIIPPPQSLL